MNSGHLLLIPGVTPADEGVYICEAQNSVGTISSSVSLAVHGNLYSKKRLVVRYYILVHCINNLIFLADLNYIN